MKLKKDFIFYFLMAISCGVCAEYSAISEWEVFINGHDELLRPDNFSYSDPLNPTFYNSYIHSLGITDRTFNYLRKLFGLGVKVDWPKDDFKRFLAKGAREQLENKRHKENLNGDCECKYIVWGDLGGNLHSFVRCLRELKRKNIIDDNFILSPGCYVVIIGSVFGATAYNLELLMTILNLMIANPERIIYLSGEQERQFQWHNSSAYHELSIKAAGDFSFLKSEIDALFSNFFDTLTISYVDRHKQNKKILLSYSGFNSLESKPYDEIAAQIKSNKQPFAYNTTNGFLLRFPEAGITTWTVFSAPSYVHQQFYKFYNDSFTILEMSSNGYDWIARHFYRKFDGEKEFKEEFYDFLTGRRFDHEVDVTSFLTAPKDFLPMVEHAMIDHGNQFVVGSHLDLSGPIKNIGIDLRNGMCLSFNQENVVNGGIKNKFLRLVALDDRYNQTLTLEQLMRLDDIFKINLLLNGLGTRPVYTAIEFSKKHDMKIIFPYTGAPLPREVTAKNVVNLRASYADEANALVDYAVNTLKKYRFVIFYQDDAYGCAGRDPAKKRLIEKYNITDILEVSHPVGFLQLDKAAEEINKFAPSAILFFSIRVAAEELIAKIGLKSLMNVAFLSVGFMSHGFADFLKTKGLSSVLSQVVPNPEGSSPIARECRDAIEKYVPSLKVNSDLFEGYISGALLIEAIKSLGDDVTSEKIITYFEGLKNFEFKGLTLNFDPNNRQLLHSVWLDVGKDDWIKIDF